MKNLLCVGLTVHNHASTIEKTLLSVIDYVDHLVIVDYGSTDNTLEIAKKILHRRKITVQIEILPLTSASHDHHHLLTLCQPLTLFSLLLYGNESVMNMDLLVRRLKSISNTPYMTCQCLYIRNDTCTYQSSVFRNTLTNLITDSLEPIDKDLCAQPFHIIMDGDPGFTNQESLQINQMDLSKYGDCVPIYHRLIQDSYRLKNYSEVDTYCHKQLDLTSTQTYSDHRYQALIIRGLSDSLIGSDEFYIWLLKAFQHSQLLYPRSDPFTIIGLVYYSRRRYDLAHTYFKKACSINSLPKGLHKTPLQINQKMDSLIRWECLSKLSYHMDKFDDHYWANEHLPDNLGRNTTLDRLTEYADNMFKI